MLSERSTTRLEHADSSSRHDWISKSTERARSSDRAHLVFMRRVVPLTLFSLLLGIPPIFQSQEERVGIRLIAVRTESEAGALRAQFQAGKSFEVLARAHSIDPSASAGGYMGLLWLSDLRPEFQRALSGLLPGRMSPTTR